MTLASTLDQSVPLAALSVFTYQGALTLLAAFLGGFLNDAMIGEISATGGANHGPRPCSPGDKRLRIASYLQALMIAPLVAAILAMRGFLREISL